MPRIQPRHSAQLSRAQPSWPKPISSTEPLGYSKKQFCLPPSWPGWHRLVLSPQTSWSYPFPLLVFSPALSRRPASSPVRLALRCLSALGLSPLQSGLREARVVWIQWQPPLPYLGLPRHAPLYRTPLRPAPLRVQGASGSKAPPPHLTLQPGLREVRMVWIQ